jgi:hypothetical protein
MATQWDDLAAIWDSLTAQWDDGAECTPVVLWDDPEATWDSLVTDWDGCSFGEEPPVVPPTEAVTRPGGKDVYARTIYNQADTLREQLLREDEELVLL